ncbi:MAG: hypothetical protein ACRD1H_12680, partial [Vicinamibacterales bacterium]
MAVTPTDGAFSNREAARALDQRHVTDLDPGDIGDGVERAGGSREGHAQLAGAGAGLSDERQREAGHQ